MSSYVVAPAARDDLLVIWRYYAEEKGEADLADRMVGEVISAFHAIAKTPGIGHLRSDLSEEPLRFWTVRKYLVIYRSENAPLEVVRVLHGARDVQAIIEARAEVLADPHILPQVVQGLVSEVPLGKVLEIPIRWRVSRRVNSQILLASNTLLVA